jgi:protein-disulfide isomerase
MMRTALLFGLTLAACHHHDDKSERDRKRSSDEITHDEKPAAATVTPTPEVVEDTTVYKVPIGSSPALGKKTALVTIVEFGDFQCNFCQRADKTLADLRAQYGDDLRVVWKNEPMAMHPRAKPAAELAMDAVDQKKDFWGVHDDLFAAQSSLDDATLANIASSRGVKRTTTHHKSLDDDHALAVSLGVTATPVFFVNGRKIVGAQGAGAFKKIIDAELAFTRAYVANGTKPEAVYDAIMASAH